LTQRCLVGKRFLSTSTEEENTTDKYNDDDCVNDIIVTAADDFMVKSLDTDDSTETQISNDKNNDYLSNGQTSNNNDQISQSVLHRVIDSFVRNFINSDYHVQM